MSIQTKISCPDCNNDIYLDSLLLFSGSSFQCTNPQCNVSISLSQFDIPKVSEAFDKFDKIKQHSINVAQSESHNCSG